MIESKGFKIDIDFLSDLKTFYIKELGSLGYHVSSDDKEEDICHKYFNLQKRLIHPYKREILISSSFSCPISHKEVLEEIKDKITKGDDLTPHLSKRILDLDYDDPMLNDWGIYHFHLGKITKGQFTDRTGDLLYARIDNDKVYFINIFSHDDWGNIDIIQIVHDNWPDSIKRFLMQGIRTNGKRYTNKEYRDLRKAGITLYASLSKDINYVLLGGGYMSSGISMEVVRSCDRLRKYIRDLQKYVVENIDCLNKQALEINKKLGNVVSFRLIIKDNDVFAYEQNLDIKFLIGKLP